MEALVEAEVERRVDQGDGIRGEYDCDIASGNIVVMFTECQNREI